MIGEVTVLGSPEARYYPVDDKSVVFAIAQIERNYFIDKDGVLYIRYCAGDAHVVKVNHQEENYRLAFCDFTKSMASCKMDVVELAVAWKMRLKEAIAEAAEAEKRIVRVQQPRSDKA